MNPVPRWGKKYETGTSGNGGGPENKRNKGEKGQIQGAGETNSGPKCSSYKDLGPRSVQTLGPLRPSLKSLRTRKGGQPHATLREEAEPLPIPLKGLLGGATQQPACDIWALLPGMVPAPSLAGSHIREDEAPL